MKKGVGYWSKDGIRNGLPTSGATWCYNWGTSPSGAPVKGVEFIPMIWDGRKVTPKCLEAARKNGKVLLSFNEPDAKNQANMPVDIALALWPQLQATGMRLGSPASASDATKDGAWLARFMAGIKAKGYRVDFICIHYYSPNYTDPKAAAEQLKAHLTRVHERYGKPIWLTEFALSNWKTPASPQQQQAFIKEVVPILERLPFLERYAWFALPPFRGDAGSLQHSHLCDENYQPNDTGVIYREIR